MRCTLGVDHFGVLKGRGDQTCLAFLHAQETAAAGCVTRLTVLRDRDRTNVQCRQIVRVTLADADIALRRADTQRLSLTIKQASVRRDNLQAEGAHCFAPFPAFSTASSIVPTKRKADSGRSSCLPSRISLKPRTVSLMGT